MWYLILIPLKYLRYLFTSIQGIIALVLLAIYGTAYIKMTWANIWQWPTETTWKLWTFSIICGPGFLALGIWVLYILEDDKARIADDAKAKEQQQIKARQAIQLQRYQLRNWAEEVEAQYQALSPTQQQHWQQLASDYSQEQTNYTEQAKREQQHAQETRALTRERSLSACPPADRAELTHKLQHLEDKLQEQDQHKLAQKLQQHRDEHLTPRYKQWAKTQHARNIYSHELADTAQADWLYRGYSKPLLPIEKATRLSEWLDEHAAF